MIRSELKYLIGAKVGATVKMDPWSGYKAVKTGGFMSGPGNKPAKIKQVGFLAGSGTKPN
jgi:hypothetical protein